MHGNQCMGNAWESNAWESNAGESNAWDADQMRSLLFILGSLFFFVTCFLTHLVSAFWGSWKVFWDLGSHFGPHFGGPGASQMGFKLRPKIQNPKT